MLTIIMGSKLCCLFLKTTISLGNLDSRRDWGHAKDYVEAMWTMLQQPSPDDFVIATGIMHSVRQFVEMAFKYVNVQILWEGKGEDEVGKDKVIQL